MTNLNVARSAASVSRSAASAGPVSRDSSLQDTAQPAAAAADDDNLFARCAEALDRVVPDLLRDMAQFLTDLPDAPNVTIPQAYLMRHLQAGPCTASGIAELLCISSGPVTSITRRLIQRGYAARRQDRADRRVVWFHLTAEGQRALNALVDARRKKWETLLHSLGPDLAQATVQVLEAMRHAVRGLRTGTDGGGQAQRDAGGDARQAEACAATPCADGGATPPAGGTAALRGRRAAKPGGSIPPHADASR